MTVIEAKGSWEGVERPTRAPSSPPPAEPSPRRGAFGRYFARSGWAHALLLLGVWLFLFPFLWMLATSVKTDEELTGSAVLPEFVTFRGASPYVRAGVTPERPADVAAGKWRELLPRLTGEAERAVGAYQAGHAAQASLGAFDAGAARASAATRLVDAAVGRLDRRLWAEDDERLTGAFRGLLTDAAVADALAESVARLELSSFQIRTLDFHIYNLTQGAAFAKDWRVESGPGKLSATGDTTLLSYDFPSASSMPVVLRHDFQLPTGVKAADLHKLLLSVRCDNSWHRVNVTLDAGGKRWMSDESTYLAQNRAQSLIYQPPTFDDELMRAKVWVTLKPVEGDAGSADEGAATIRVTVTPSSTPVANWGKVVRNYDRAFKSVPFWLYIRNSVILVALCTAGSLFSAAFVGYAFARLNWPGRSVALLLLLATIMLPAQVTMIPGFMIWRALHWYNTLNPLWVPSFFGSAFFVFLMTQHMRTIPRELEEAARIDGLNAVQSWYYVILPNVKPTLAAIAILSFMGAWNEFMGPLIYLRDQSRFPLSLGLYGLGLLRIDSGADYSWTVVMAGNMLMTLPVIAVFFLFQRYFVQSMTMTGMKG